ncbi:MAG TPA: carbohydrate kinase [Verrucomicrobiales bacterium]|nr:carbohydrate kinase [Verrucomicrobiales bacterium]
MSCRVVGMGELLWDLLPGGREVGGAPANFAFHAGSMGAEAWVVSRVGRDEAGAELLEQLHRMGMSTGCVERDDSLPTGTVEVEVGVGGEPRFRIREGVAWDNLRGEAAAVEIVGGADAICFGTLAQRCVPSRSAIRRLLRAARPHALKVLDVNLRQEYHSPEVIRESIELADVVKVNEQELPRMAEALGLPRDPATCLGRMAADHGLRAVVMTRGGAGSLVLADGRWADHPGVPTQVRDTVGAGDSFTAAVTLGLLSGWDAERVSHAANQVASHVASCPGATPRLPDSLRSLFLPSSPHPLMTTVDPRHPL